MCHLFLRSVSRPALRLLPLGSIFAAALVVGCDSSGDPTSPEAQKAVAASRENIQKNDAAASEQLKKNAKGGKGATSVKNIKGGIKTPGAE
jgi:hypothetical protein